MPVPDFGRLRHQSKGVGVVRVLPPAASRDKLPPTVPPSRPSCRYSVMRSTGPRCRRRQQIRSRHGALDKGPDAFAACVPLEPSIPLETRTAITSPAGRPNLRGHAPFCNLEVTAHCRRIPRESVGPKTSRRTRSGAAARQYQGHPEAVNARTGKNRPELAKSAGEVKWARTASNTS